jgi:hypothetical protein
MQPRFQIVPGFSILPKENPSMQNQSNKPTLTSPNYRCLLHIAIAISFLTLLLSLAGCSKSAGANSMKLKWPGMNEKEMPVKSSYAFGVTKTFTDINQKISTAPSYRVYAASYDLDSGNFAQTMDKPLAGDDQIRVTFSLVGDQGGNEKSPLKAGDYSAKADKFMKVEDVSIVTRKDGKDNTVWFERGAINGTVKVTSVSDGNIVGDVDLTSGDSAIKGPFTAKVLLRK